MCACECPEGGTRAEKAILERRESPGTAECAAGCCSRCPPRHQHHRIIQLQNPPHSCSCASERAAKSSLTHPFVINNVLLRLPPDVFSSLFPLFKFFFLAFPPRLFLSLVKPSASSRRCRSPRRHPALPAWNPTKFPGRGAAGIFLGGMRGRERIRGRGWGWGRQDEGWGECGGVGRDSKL